MNNIINDRLQKLLPYLRGFFYDDQMYIRISLLVPINWDYSHLKKKNLIIDGKKTESTMTIVVGVPNQQLEDSPIDELFNEVETMISINQEVVKKQELLTAKFKELQKFINNSTLDEIENLKILPNGFLFEKEEESQNHFTENPIMEMQNTIMETHNTVIHTENNFIGEIKPIDIPFTFKTVDNEVFGALSNAPIESNMRTEIPKTYTPPIDDGGIVYNGNVELPPPPGIIDDVEYFKMFKEG